MKAYIPDYELRSPRDLSAALQLLAEDDVRWTPMAGGTDLMVLFEAGELPPGNYLNVWGLDELRGRVVTDDTIALGALTTYSAIRADETLQVEFPMLCDAARETGSVAIQNRGTLGGNIVNASPAADSPPALLAYDAQIELTSASGSRWIDYKDFHTDYKKMRLEPAELLTNIRLPRSTRGAVQRYQKVGTRKAQAISKVCMAALARLGSNKSITDIRLAFGSVAPIPLRCMATEDTLRNKQLSPSLITDACTTLAGEISPIDDIRSTRRYRQRVSENLLRAFLESL